MIGQWFIKKLNYYFLAERDTILTHTQGQRSLSNKDNIIDYPFFVRRY